VAPKAWSQQEAQEFIEAIRGDPLEALWVLMLTSGLRRGEALALQWDDIDFDASTVSISKALVQVNGVPTMSKPKTQKSYRTIALGEGTVQALRAHRRRQTEERLAADEWVDPGHIFTRLDGSAVRPDRAYVCFKRIVEREGLPWITLHGLRHTMASRYGWHPETHRCRRAHPLVGALSHSRWQGPQPQLRPPGRCEASRSRGGQR
jgi:integrase